MATKKSDAVVAPQDLHKKLAELRKELADSKRAQAANELPNPRVITKTRREIARTLTELNASKKKEASNA